MQKSKPSPAGAAAVAAPARQPADLECLLDRNPTPERFGIELSRMFQVRPSAVALLRLEKGLLKFLFPEELKAAGSIPLSSSSAVAAHTAAIKKVELFNSFARVKHASIFETQAERFREERRTAAGCHSKADVCARARCARQGLGRGPDLPQRIRLAIGRTRFHP